MSEIESRLYDQFTIKISDVKILLADSGELLAVFFKFIFILIF